MEMASANALALPFADNTFDKVICSEVLEHIPDYQGALHEIERVLKPNGIAMHLFGAAAASLDQNPHHEPLVTQGYVPDLYQQGGHHIARYWKQFAAAVSFALSPLTQGHPGFSVRASSRWASPRRGRRRGRRSSRPAHRSCSGTGPGIRSRTEPASRLTDRPRRRRVVSTIRTGCPSQERPGPP